MGYVNARWITAVNTGDEGKVRKAQRVTSRQAPVGKVGQASHKSKIRIEVERANRKYLDKGFGREQIGPRIRDSAEA